MNTTVDHYLYLVLTKNRETMVHLYRVPRPDTFVDAQLDGIKQTLPHEVLVYYKMNYMDITRADFVTPEQDAVFTEQNPFPEGTNIQEWRSIGELYNALDGIESSSELGLNKA